MKSLLTWRLRELKDMLLFHTMVDGKSPYQSHVNGEFHADADRRDQDDHRHGAQLDSDEAHHAKELDRHQRQDRHLSGGTGMSGWAQTRSRYGNEGRLEVLMWPHFKSTAEKALVPKPNTGAALVQRQQLSCPLVQPRPLGREPGDRSGTAGTPRQSAVWRCKLLLPHPCSRKHERMQNGTRATYGGYTNKNSSLASHSLLSGSYPSLNFVNEVML